MTLGQLIRREREARGWSRATLAVKLGEIGDPPTTYGDTKLGALEKDLVRYINPDLVRRLIEVLELDPDEAVEAAYPEVVELLSVGGARPARAAGGAGVGRPADQGLGTNRK
jgi:transcriptional regulator with XRE-family HTH domain